MAEVKETDDSNFEIPRDVGAWAMQQGVTVNEFEQKAADSLRNKEKVHLKLQQLINRFEDFEKRRLKFILSMVALAFLIILQFLQVVRLVTRYFIIELVEAIFSLGIFGYLIFRITKILWKNKEIGKEFSEIDKTNGFDENGKAKPDSLEIVAQTFVPGLKNFMEAYGSHLTQEHIKEMLKSAMEMYDIYNEKGGILLKELREIRYSDESSLLYLIDKLNKATGVDIHLMYLAYYDYVKDPFVKNKLKSILSDKELKPTKKKLFQLFEPSFSWGVSLSFSSDLVDSIITEVLEEYVSNDKIYTLRAVKAELSELNKRAGLNFNMFVNNLDIFGLKVDLEKLTMYNVKELSLEFLKEGDLFINMVLSTKAINNKVLNVNHLRLIYHYNDSESVRRALITDLGKENKEIFASFIYKDVLGNQKPVSEEILGIVLSSIGDFKIEKIGNKFNSILELLDFLNIAEKALEAIGFLITTNVNTDEYIKKIATRIVSESEDRWVSYYQEYFNKLTDWNKQLCTMFPKSVEYSIQKYVTILFILFCNGKLHFQPRLDKIKLNSSYSSAEADIETLLLKFSEMSQGGNISDIPKLILNILTNSNEDEHPYFVELFHREFVLGSIPSYDFLVSQSNTRYLEQTNELISKSNINKEDRVFKKIVDTIFSIKLDNGFIKSMLIGGAVNAYLIFKPSKEGNLITILKNGARSFRSKPHLNSFESFLDYSWKNLDIARVPHEFGHADFYKVDFSGYAVILGIVPEGMSFTDFSITMDRSIEAYLKELKREASLIEGSNKEAKAALNGLNNIKGWEIFPLDISTVRKAFETKGPHPSEKGYIEMITNLFKKENTEKKLAWIGMIENKGNILENNNLRSIIYTIARQDRLGFSRYLEFDQSYFNAKEGISVPDINGIFTENTKEILNVRILELIGTNSFLDACDVIMRKHGTSKDEFLRSKLREFILKIDNIELKLTIEGIEYYAKQINAIARAFDLLIGPQKIP